MTPLNLFSALPKIFNPFTPFNPLFKIRCSRSAI